MKPADVMPHTLRVLQDGGWHEGHRVEARKLWIDPLEREGYRCFPAALAILDEFGGLRYRPPECEDYLPMDFHFDALEEASGEFDRMEFYQERAGEPLFPLGEVFHYRIFLVGESGKIYVGDTGKIYLLADGIEMALDYMISVNPTDAKEL